MTVDPREALDSMTPEALAVIKDKAAEAAVAIQALQAAIMQASGSLKTRKAHKADNVIEDLGGLDSILTAIMSAKARRVHGA